MPNDFYFDIFLSYSKENEDEAKKLYHVLKSNGLRVWFDLVQLEPNNKYLKEEIYIALKYCPVFICLLNQSYVEKKYCVEEYRHAFRANKSIITLMTEKIHLVKYGFIGFLVSLSKICNLQVDVDNFLDNYTGSVYEDLLTKIRECYKKNVSF